VIISNRIVIRAGTATLIVVGCLAPSLPFAKANDVKTTDEPADGQLVSRPVAQLGEMVRGFFGDDKELEGAPAVTAPSALEGDAAESLLAPVEYLTQEEIRTARPWNEPNYAKQVGALGWNESVFDVPPGMKERVAFWRDIYTKYTTDEGVIHDSVNLGVVYTPINFSEISKDSSLSPRQKAKAKEKLIKDKKAEIAQRLLSLHGRETSEGLTSEDLRVWNLFEGINSKDRFKDAAAKGRLRFQLGQRDKFVIGIFHSGRYLTQMQKVFREEGLPVELTRLPFVESSFNLRAKSRVGASGIWQFMPRTARPYMKVNREVDERNDPLKATRASARMLRTNYQMLQSWPLAITGYNHGPSGVKRIADKVGTRDLAKIIDTYSSKTFGFASENFYACFLAALQAEREAKKHFGEPRWGPASETVEIKLARSVPYKTIVQFFDGDLTAAELANPHLTSRVRKGSSQVPARSYLRVPPTRAQLAEDWIAGKYANPAAFAKALIEFPMRPVQDGFLPPEKLANPPTVQSVDQSTSGERKP
jgi:membrane-bound lytic murein transglycosylase D